MRIWMRTKSPQIAEVCFQQTDAQALAIRLAGNEFRWEHRFGSTDLGFFVTK